MKVVIVSGPTASGKTRTSIELATRFGGEIVNFDSLLLYREINIGTAKPSMVERNSIPHHMLDVAPVTSPMNASEYAKMALPIVNRLLSEKKNVYLVGGSGFYLQALLKGMYDSPTTPVKITQRSDDLYHEKGISPFLEVLKEHDPGSHQRYHANDHYRIRRAVEHWWSNGTPLSSVRQEKNEANLELNATNVHGWEVLHLHLDLPKPEHLELIRKRTGEMLKHGLIEEVRSLLHSGLSGHEKPLQSIGYKETLGYINGTFKTLEECEERIITSTRQLAKSQRTWFNRDPSKKCFHPLRDKEAIASEVAHFLSDAL